ncbi:MAG: hypothetical protein ACI9JN_001445 [Bacteroidia bacterium]|jgi:hypothetical protein
MKISNIIIASTVVLLTSCGGSQSHDHDHDHDHGTEAHEHPAEHVHGDSSVNHEEHHEQEEFSVSTDSVSGEATKHHIHEDGTKHENH